MARVYPITALHYNPKAVPITDALAPPYDVITPAEAEGLRKKSPYNFVHIDLPRKEEDDYEPARALLQKWCAADILKAVTSPHFFVYQQTFTLDGEEHCRNTLLCAVELSDFGKGVVRPHEQTYEKYKKDRLQITRQTKCNLSPIFGMVKDVEGKFLAPFEKTMYEEPLLQGITDDGVEHSLWMVDPEKTERVESYFRQRPIYIVDGHHRYLSALKYAQEEGALENPEHPAGRVLFAIANAYDPALIIRPTHRCVTGIDPARVTLDILQKSFEMKPCSQEELAEFVKAPVSVPCLAVYLMGKLYHCTPRQWTKESAKLGTELSKLSVFWSDHKLLGEICGIGGQDRGSKVNYAKSLDQAWDQRDAVDLTVFLPPLEVEAVLNLADASEFMPPKATYFYPKLASGILIRTL